MMLTALACIQKFTLIGRLRGSRPERLRIAARWSGLAVLNGALRVKSACDRVSGT